jgi:DNA-binding PadR family transcriptional regulator
LKEEKMSILTLNEEMLLVTILSLEDNAYGVTIMEKLREVSHKRIVFGTLYNSLSKLVEKGYVVTILGEPTHERGGKRKVYYHLTPAGRASLEKTRSFHLALWKKIPG